MGIGLSVTLPVLLEIMLNRGMHLSILKILHTSNRDEDRLLQA